MDVNRVRAGDLKREEDDFNRYVSQKRAQHRLLIDEMNEAHSEEVGSLAKQYQNNRDHADLAYKVTLTKMTESHAKDIDVLARSHEKELTAIRKANEKEFEKVRERERKRIEDYKRNQDSRLEEMHTRYQEAIDEMRDKQR